MDSHDTTTKPCTRCLAIKPVIAFRLLKGEPYYRCKACEAEVSRAWYRENKARALAAKHVAYHSDIAASRARALEKRAVNRDKLNADKRAHYAANSERLKQEKRATYASSPEVFKSRVMAQYASNPEKFYARNAKRRAAQLRASPSWADNEAIAAIYAEAAARRRNGEDVHVDHQVPLQGEKVCGLHVHNNLEIIGADLNLQKSARFEV